MNKLRDYRERNRLSQEEFAKSVEVKKAMISRIENGERSPSLALIKRICKITSGELTANDFMDVDEKVAQ